MPTESTPPLPIMTQLAPAPDGEGGLLRVPERIAAALGLPLPAGGFCSFVDLQNGEVVIVSDDTFCAFAGDDPGDCASKIRTFADLRAALEEARAELEAADGETLLAAAKRVAAELAELRAQHDAGEVLRQKLADELAESRARHTAELNEGIRLGIRLRAALGARPGETLIEAVARVMGELTEIRRSALGHPGETLIGAIAKIAAVLEAHDGESLLDAAERHLQRHADLVTRHAQAMSDISRVKKICGVEDVEGVDVPSAVRQKLDAPEPIGDRGVAFIVGTVEMTKIRKVLEAHDGEDLLAAAERAARRLENWKRSADQLREKLGAKWGESVNEAAERVVRELAEERAFGERSRAGSAEILAAQAAELEQAAAERAELAELRQLVANIGAKLQCDRNVILGCVSVFMNAAQELEQERQKTQALRLACRESEVLRAERDAAREALRRARRLQRATARSEK